MRRFIRWIPATLVSWALVLNPMALPRAHAGFLDEFTSSVTSQPGALTAGGTRVYSAGGGAIRMPGNRSLAVGITPPSFKAGCNGIDIYMGSIGLPTRAEMVQFLQAVGQNMGGLAFQIALQAVSPELSAQIENFSKTVQEWNRYAKNSCQSAKMLMDSPAMRTLGASVYGAVRGDSQGWVAGEQTTKDYNQLLQKTGIAGSWPVADSVAVNTATGKPVDFKVNWTWYLMAMNAGAGAQDASITAQSAYTFERWVILNLLGTTVYDPDRSRTGADGQATLFAQPYEARLDPSEAVAMLAFGDGNPAGMTPNTNPLRPLGTRQYLACRSVAFGTSTDCLDVDEAAGLPSDMGIPLYQQLQGAIGRLVGAQQTRTPYATAYMQQDLGLVSQTASVSLVKLINMAGSTRYGGVVMPVMDKIAQAMALEIAANRVRSILAAAGKASGTSSPYVGKQLQDESRRIEQAARMMIAEVQRQQGQIYRGLDLAQSMIAQIDHLERAMYGNMANDLAANLAWQRGAQALTR